MLKILQKILVVLLLAIIFISNAYSLVKAAYEITKADIIQIGEADYHLKYYKEEKGIYTYCTCSIVGYYEDGKFYPAYCLNRDMHGVGAVDSYAVDVDSLINNPQVWRAVKNGYPYKTASEMGLSSDFDAFAVTKFAIYCLIGQADINLYIADDEDTEGQAMLNALHNLVDIGLNGKESFNDEIKITKAGELVEDGEYYSIIYSVNAGSTISKYNLTSIEGLLEGDIVTDVDGNLKNSFNSGEKFKIKISKNNLNFDKNINIGIEAELKSHPLFYGKTRISGTQNYLLTANSYQKVEASLNTNLKLNTGKIEVNKIDSDTKEGISDTVFELYNSENVLVATLVTNEQGKLEFTDLYQGTYKLKETKANENYILNENQEFEVNVEYNKTSKVDIENEHIRGKIRVVKSSESKSEIAGIDAGSPIADVEFEVYDENGKVIDTIKTNKDGIAITKDLEKGTYKVKEILTNKWYLLDEKEYTVKIEKNHQVETLNIKNKPATPNEEIEKKGSETAIPNEEIEYKINVKNTGNVTLDDFIWEDEIPTDYIKVTKIKLGTYNQENAYDLYYKTNLTENYVLLLEDLSTLQEDEVDFSKELADGEYITNIKLDYGKVNAGFESAFETKVLAKVNSNVKNGGEFENKVTLNGNYKGYNLTRESKWITKIYKILPMTGI